MDPSLVSVHRSAMSRHCPSMALGLALAFSFAPPVHAQAVHIVGSGGVPAYPDIQSAVDAAAEGDVLLVAEGVYPEFEIASKSLSIFAMPDADVRVGNTPGLPHQAIVVRNLGPDQRVLLSGISAVDWYPLNRCLEVLDNAGYVSFQDCSFLSDTASVFLAVCEPFDGAPAAYVRNSDRVAFTDCELRGGIGDWKDTFDGNCAGSTGGAGLYALDAEVALYDCDLTGGEGGGAKYIGGVGGYALDLNGSEAFLSGTSLQGGAGGWIYGGPPGIGPGGDALKLPLSSTSTQRGCLLTPGVGVPPGELVDGDGPNIQLDGPARVLEAPTLAAYSVPFSGSFYGASGDLIWVLAEDRPKFRVFPFGVLQVEAPVPFPAPIGVAPHAGPVVVPLDISAYPPGVVGLQSFAASATGTRQLSSARFTLGLDPAAGPDCNGNGINDYLDLAGGLSADADQDLVPDECP